jgi:hypothetical protein
MGKRLQCYLQPVRSRQRLILALRLSAWGLLLGASLGLAAAGMRRWLGGEPRVAAVMARGGGGG